MMVFQIKTEGLVAQSGDHAAVAVADAGMHLFRQVRVARRLAGGTPALGRAIQAALRAQLGQQMPPER